MVKKYLAQPYPMVKKYLAQPFPKVDIIYLMKLYCLQTSYDVHYV